MLNQVDWSMLLSGATALIALVLTMNLAFHRRFRTAKRVWFVRFGTLLFVSLILYSAVNLAIQLLNGVPGRGPRVFLQIACVSGYLLSGMLAFSFSGLLLASADPRNEKRVRRALLIALVLGHALLVLAGALSGFIYRIDADNLYQRSAGYLLSLLAPALMLLLDVWVLARGRKELEREDRLELWGILVIHFLDVVLQCFVQNVTPVAVAAASLLLYAMMTRKEIRLHSREREENQRLRTEILLSEIQPHFMYNTLGALAELCDSDPAEAKRATLLFSRYLQGVMGALNTQMIPFSQELEQLRLYLELAQIRFEDALRVEYQIECTDFVLPSMCLQPLVENAIRHGVRKNKEGRGTVLLRTAERADRWEVSVSDDGPGIPALKRPDRERVRVGLANVRERLRLICGGSLELSSEAGQGTTAVVCIPK